MKNACALSLYFFLYPFLYTQKSQDKSTQNVAFLQIVNIDAQESSKNREFLKQEHS